MTLPPARPARYTGGVADQRRALGRAAEDAAAAFLARAGLSVVERNVRLPEGEIDLVCRHRGAWVFVEVKARRAAWGDAPGAAVSWGKQRRLLRLAERYLKQRRLGDARCRFDVVAVTVGDDGALHLRHLPAAFDASP